MFKYKTRGNSSPQGKQKVYFACHPNDFDAYFGKISAQILKFENCAVWYQDSGENSRDIEKDIDEVKSRLNEAADYGGGGVICRGQENFSEAEENYKKCIELSEKLAKETKAVEPLRNIMVSCNRLGDIYMEKGNLSEAEACYKKALELGGEHAKQTETTEFYHHMSVSLERLGDIRKAQGNLSEAEEYYGKAVEMNKELVAEFGGMKLFVIPVTSKLLTTLNRTMDMELPYALKNHIPILPLMQESGLDELFNIRFGSLHYLDENAGDDTAAPYEEKLKRYLSSVIVGDELSAKVRAAFDAYIFLSYRKKDRKHAHELMRLIHKNDFCRDIAIWYDEFLTPGENFNSAIEDALKKSELFALVVTPNIVSEQNYVQTTEYPMAKMAEKKILPAEMVNTDHEKLSKMYSDIPECVDAKTGAMLSEALLNSLQSIAKAENDNDPMHNFFIGLAYLNGIDVEIDTERAKDLITSSAEAGLNEAAKKLVSMYQNGDGVERDYLKAIEWQRKLTERLRDRYVNSGSLEDGAELIVELWNLGDCLFDMQSLSEAESAYREMKSISLKFLSLRTLSVSYNKLGDVNRARGKFDEAEEYYKKDFELSEKLAGETGKVESLRDLSLSCERLGDVNRERGKFDEAAGYYEKGLELREKLAKETGTVLSLRDLSVSYNKLGDMSCAHGMTDEAERYYVKSLELREKLAEETGTVLSLRDLSVSYNKLGDVSRERGKLDEAEEYYVKGFELREKLAKETGTFESCRDLSVSYSRLGEMSRERGKLDEAEEYYKKYFELSEKLAKETGAVLSLRDLSVSCDKLGDMCRERGKLDEAEEYYKKGLELSKKLAEKTGMVESYDDLGVSYCKCATVKKTSDKTLLLQAFRIYDMLANQCPSVPKYAKNRDSILNIIRKAFISPTT